MGMSLEEALKCINDGSKVNELEIDTRLRPDQLTQLLNCLKQKNKKQKNNTTLFQIKYSLNLFTKENEKSKEAVSHLESFLLCNRLCSSDVNILEKYKDDQNTLDCPFTVNDISKFDNALHFYLYCLGSFHGEINRSGPATQDQYDVINYLLDKGVTLTLSTQKLLLSLVRRGCLSTYRLRLHKDDDQKEGKGFYIAKYEQAKILGNSLGLAGQFKLSDMPAEFQDDDTNKFEGMQPMHGAICLLEALEQFVMKRVSIQFPQWTDHMAKVIAIVKEGLHLHSLPVEEKINSVLDKLKQGEVVYLYHCGYDLHNAPIILSPQSKSNLGMLIVCNKGDGMQEDKIATYYQLPDEKKLKHILKVAWIEKTKYPSMDAYLGSIEGLKEIKALGGKAQKVGSCVISNNRVAYHVIMDLCLGDKEVAKEIYKAFSEFQRTFELECVIDSPIARKDKWFMLELLGKILIFQHDAAKQNEVERMNLIVAELSKDRYPINVDGLLSKLSAEGFLKGFEKYVMECREEEKLEMEKNINSSPLLFAGSNKVGQKNEKGEMPSPRVSNFL